MALDLRDRVRHGTGATRLNLAPAETGSAMFLH